jgi:hypothetical protein
MMDFRLLWSRMLRASKLDINLYEEVEADQDALGQAGIAVILSSLAAGLGGMSQGGALGLLVMTVGSLVSWCVWAYLTYLVGTRLLPEPQTRADFGELLRTIGFSSSPGVVRILGIVPGLAGLANLVGGVWMLIAMVIAVRQALDYRSTWRAVGVCVIGWVVQALILLLLIALLRAGAA